MGNGLTPEAWERARLTRRAFLTRTAGFTAGASALGTILAACGGDSGGAAEPAGAATGAPAATGAASAGSAASSGSLKPVTYVFILPPNLSFAPELLADQKGYFNEEGIDVSFQQARGSAPAIQLLIQGQATVATGVGMEIQLHILREQAPIKCVGTIQHASPIGFAYRADEQLDTPESWVGRTMGVSSPGGSSELTFRIFLAKGGVDPDDVNIQVVTGATSASTIDLIRQGRLDGAVIGEVQLAGYEFPDIAFVPFSRFLTDTFSYVTGERQAQEQKEELTAYFRAIRRAMNEIMDDKANGFANTISALRETQDFAELEDDAIATAWLDLLTRQWTGKGEENVLVTLPEEWQEIYDGIVLAELAPGGRDPMPWMTNEFVQA